MDKEVIYNLSEEFEYAFKGEVRNAKFVTLKAPTVSNISSVAKLKQGFMQAISGQKNEENKKKKTGDNDEDLNDLTGALIMAMLSMSDVDYAKYLETAKSVFIESEICLIDGELKFNKSLFSKLSFDDMEGMTGEYLRVFILSSVLTIMQT